MDENTQKEIERYLHDEFSDEEKALFLQKMEANLLLKEEVLLQESIHNILSTKGNTSQNTSFKKEDIEELKNLLKSEKYQEIQSNIKTNTAHYLASQKSNSRKKNQYRIALAIAVVFVAIIIMMPFLNNTTSQNYYTEYADWNVMPSFVEKGVVEKNLIDIELSYNSQNYFNTIRLIESLSEKSKTNYPNLSIYLGASYFHQNNYKKALETFNEFSKSNAYDYSKGFWFISLIYLKQNKIKEAKKVLKIIKKNKYYNYKKSIQLLKEID